MNYFVDKRSCYKLFLERIVEEGEFGYEEIPEILNRHYTLKQANKDLLDHSTQVCRILFHAVRFRY